MKSTLLLGALCAFLAMPTYGQQSTELAAQIKQKEAERNAASTSSRSVNQTISTELHDLYLAYKEQLEVEIGETSDAATKASKEAELQTLTEKLKQLQASKN